jgi:primosomal protein N' (replication factor Y) (superfamily II helicase)
MIARVLPDVSGLEKQFDYLVPEAIDSKIQIGSLVRVDLAGRRVGGWVVGLDNDAEGRPAGQLTVDKLKPIAKLTGIGPSESVVDLARWTARRWAGRWRSVLTAASPPRAVPLLNDERHGKHVALTIDRSAAELLDAGGGVLRVTPTNDYIDIVAAALALGPTLVITPSVDMARRIGGELRRLGVVPALAGRDWVLAASGIDLVIGARSAVFASAPGLRSIVVLDEHDEGLQEERNPTWHARDVAIERAARIGIPCLLVSPAPTPNAVSWTDGNVVSMSRQDERTGWPIVEAIDRSAEEPWVTSLVTPRLIAVLRDHTQRVVCVLNTKGRAKRLACRTCRQLTVCEHCGAAVIQRSDGVLVCPLCATERPVVCQHCGAGALALLRPGVTRLREELEAAAGRPVVEITGATDTDLHVDPTVDVFVGTEAVLHRVRQATVVAFLDFDSELLSARYRAVDQAVSLVVRAARLVGPRSNGGRVLLQTRDAQHPVVDALVHVNPASLSSAELRTRKLLGFPPFQALAIISGTGVDEFAAGLKTDGRVTVSGPADAGYLVRADTPDDLADALDGQPRPTKSRIRVEVDPPRV